MKPPVIEPPDDNDPYWSSCKEDDNFYNSTIESINTWAPVIFTLIVFGVIALVLVTCAFAFFGVAIDVVFSS